MGDDFFGGMFDFDGNGVTDIGEAWEAYNIYEECTHEDELHTPHTKKASYNTQTENTHKEVSDEKQESLSEFTAFIIFMFIPSLIFAVILAKDSNGDVGTALVVVLFVASVILHLSCS